MDANVPFPVYKRCHMAKKSKQYHLLRLFLKPVLNLRVVRTKSFSFRYTYKLNKLN